MAPEKPGRLKTGHWMAALALALCAGISSFCFAILVILGRFSRSLFPESRQKEQVKSGSPHQY